MSVYHADAVEVSLQGFNELMVLLKKLPKQMKTEVMQKGLQAGVLKIKNGAQATAPIGSTGRIANAIKTKKGKETNWTVSRDTYVDPGKNRQDQSGAYYAHMVEFGHWLVDRKDKTKRIKFVPANPFMRRAFLTNVNSIVDNLFKRTVRELKKVGSTS
jgi:hypothetical protein